MGDLPVTGQLNAETITLMNTSRCGTKDPIEKLNKTEDGRKEIGRYYIQGTRWNKKVYCLFWSEWLGILSFYLMDRRLQDCFFFGEIAKSEIAKVTLYSPERSNDGFFKRFTSVEEVWNKRKSLLVIYQYSGQWKSILLSDQFFFSVVVARAIQIEDRKKWTQTTNLTNQMQNRNRSRIGHPRFFAVLQVHLFLLGAVRSLAPCVIFLWSDWPLWIKVKHW